MKVQRKSVPRPTASGALRQGCLLAGVGWLASCTPAEPQYPDYTLSYTIPTVDGVDSLTGDTEPQVDALSFDPGLSISGGFTLQASPCDPGQLAVVGDEYNGYTVVPTFDPYDCAEDPAEVDISRGTVQFYVDGIFMGVYDTLDVELDLTPKITLAYYAEAGELAAADPENVPPEDDPDNDLNGNGDLSDDYYVLCNFYFPDDNLGSNRLVVEHAADALGLYADLYAANTQDAPLLEHQMLYDVWAWMLTQGAYFDYLEDYRSSSTTVPDEWHSFQAQLMDDTHAAIPGTLGERIVTGAFTANARAELSAWSPDGVPWCGDVLGIANPFWYNR